MKIDDLKNKLQPAFKKHNIEKAILFGSLARGEASRHSAEKAMKALWLAIDDDPWGHSIQKKVMQFPQQDRSNGLQNWISNAAYLDKFYIPTRYPNGLPDLTPSNVYYSEDAVQAIEKAGFFLEETRKLLENLQQEQ
ncbi:HEPN domain-containing protein [Chloroflexi bacterium CFX6]|nr:HEPN domain-containing protein [Chloroflexi bacterium CFX6]